MGKKPSARVRRAGETNEAVERIIACSNRLWSDLGPDKIPLAQDNVRRLRRGEEAWWPPAMRYQFGEHLVSLMDHVSRQAVVDLWRSRGRIAYDIHPEMAAQLYRADMRGKLPGGLFQRLPHINPLIPLPRPWPFRSSNKREGLIRAYFLTGRIGQAFCHTKDPRSEGLVAMPWIEWAGARADEYMQVVTPLFGLPSTEQPFTLDDVVEQTNSWQGTPTDGTEKKLIKQIIPGLVSLLTYLCCDNRDVQPPAQSATGKQRSSAPPPRDPFYVRVGWHIGPKLHAARMLAQGGGHARGGVSVPSGVEYGPQHRAGHYKQVHHGPNRSLTSLRWVDPYWTKLDLLEQMEAEGKEPGTGIIPVVAQRKDPSSHRDVKLSNLGRAKEKEIREREAQRTREEGWDW